MPAPRARSTGPRIGAEASDRSALPDTPDSSRSSSPELGRIAQNQNQNQSHLQLQAQTHTLTCYGRRESTAAETARPRSRASQALQGRLSSARLDVRLDDTVAALAAAAATANRKGVSSEGAEPPRGRTDLLAKLNSNQSNNRHGGEREGRVLGQSLRRLSGDDRTANKILSGLKLRRCGLGKGEQLHFV